LSEQQKIRYHNDPEYREKVLTQQKDYRALPEVQAHTQAYKIAYYSQPENLEHKRTHDRAYHTTPEYRQHQRSYYRSHVKERRNHPVYREHRRAYEKSPKVRTHKWAYQHLPHVHEHTLHYFRNYREENRESLNFYSRVRRQKPEVREKNLIRMRNYEQRPEVKAQKLVRKHIRRARENAVTGTYTVAQIKDLLKHQRYRCYYCHKKFEKRKGKYVYHIDHTFPLSRMVGTAIPANDISYLELACPPCNVSKGNKFPWEWHKGGRLL
jgi:hypothetical protein